MADISQTVNKTSTTDKIGDGKSPNTNSVPAQPVNTPSSSGEVNRTDPKVCHDPSITVEGIVRKFSNQNKVNFENGEYSANNIYDSTLIDGIEYPLIAVNDRNIEHMDIISMTIEYKNFLPQIALIIRDNHQEEQKINTTQMSSIIRVCILSRVDAVYRKIGRAHV